MANVPRYSDQQVQATGLPNVRVSDNGATPEAFGAGIGRGLADFAQVATQIADREREKADTASLMEAQKAFSDLDLELLNDPEKGAFAKQGKDAIGIQQTVLPEWDRRASDIIGKVPARVQAKAQQYAMQRRESAAERLMSHSLQQGDRYYTERADSTIKLFQSEAIANRMDPTAVDKAADQAMQAAEEAGRLRGLSDEGRTVLRRAAASTTYRGAIEALANDDPLGAEVRYAQVRGFLTPEDQLEVDKLVRPLVQDREDAADLQRVLGGIGPARQVFDGPLSSVKADTGVQKLPLEQRRALPYNAPELDAYAAHVEQQYDLPAGLINALKNAGEKSNSNQVSPSGARGVMQFMPQNLRKYGVTDATDPVQMIEAAGKYLRDTMRQYGGNVDAVIADYNGGPKQANRVRSGGEPTAEETRAYLGRVKAALGAVDAGQSQTVAVKPPTSEVETLRMIDEQFRDNPVKRERMRRLASREWGMRNAEKADRDRGMGEAIYTKIYAADPRKSLASILSKDERDWAIKEGRLDAFEGDLTRRANGQLTQSDPVLVDALTREAILSPSTFAKRDITQSVGRLATDDLSRLMKLQADLRDPSKKDKALADWSTEEQRIARGAVLLGFDKKGKEADKQAFAAFYRLAEQSFVQAHGKKPDGAQADALVRSAVQSFANDPEQGRKVRSAESLALGKDLGEGVQLSEADRATVRQALRARGIANPTEAQILQVAGQFYAGANRAD